MAVNACVRVTAKPDAYWWAAISGHGMAPGWVPRDHLQLHPPDLELCVEYLEVFRKAKAGEISQEEMVSYCQVRCTLLASGRSKVEHAHGFVNRYATTYRHARVPNDSVAGVHCRQ